MKLSIKAETIVTANVDNGSKILTQDDEWVTWYKEIKKNVWEISTCEIMDFECQNDTRIIQLTTHEIKELIRVIKK
jgi:hypothetical protein